MQSHKDSRIQRLIYAIIALVAFFVSPISAQFFGNNSDFLEQVFSPSKSHEQVINIGNDKISVGREVLNPSTTIQIGGGTPTVAQREPLLVRFTKFLLRLTIVLSVTMVIYTGIRYILAAGDEEGMKNARQNLLYIILGILLALMSYGIIVLLESIGFSTLSNF
jgi:hypothetical protein